MFDLARSVMDCSHRFDNCLTLSLQEVPWIAHTCLTLLEVSWIAHTGLTLLEVSWIAHTGLTIV